MLKAALHLRASALVSVVLLPWLVTRAALLAVGLLAPLVIPKSLGSGVWDPTAHDWLNIWSRWDGIEYLLIAHEGYSYTPGRQSNIAFAPLYPLLLKLGSGAGYEGTLLAGLIVSNVALLVALGLLYRLALLDFDAETARRAVLYVLVFPTTLFLSALYPESLLLALAIGGLYCGRRGTWWAAGGLGFLAALTRPYGALLVVPLAYEYLAQRHFAWRAIRRDVAALALLPAGFAVWAGYVAWLTGDPSAVFSVQAAWGRDLAPPWQTFVSFFSEPLAGHGSRHSPLDLGFALLFLGLVVATWSRVSRTLALQATVFYVLLLSSGPLIALMRNALQLFPVFLVLALSGRFRLFHWAFLVASGAMALRFMAAFAQGYWVA